MSPDNSILMCYWFSWYLIPASWCVIEYCWFSGNLFLAY